MTFDIDMTVSGGDEILTGTHLWRIASAAPERSRGGDRMLVLKLTCTRPGHADAKLTDRLMFEGRGWGIARGKLMALGIGVDFKGKLDPLSLVDRRVWVATVERSYSYEKDGEKRTGKDCSVDINQLKHNGYQAEQDVPPGCDIDTYADSPF
jgi:hypothetical protein